MKIVDNEMVNYTEICIVDKIVWVRCWQSIGNGMMQMQWVKSSSLYD